MISRLTSFLWALFLITFPFGYRVLVFEDWSYRFGNFNPWVSGFVYLSELLLVGIFILWLFEWIRRGYGSSPAGTIADVDNAIGRWGGVWEAINGHSYGVLLILFLVNLLVVSAVQGTFILALFLSVRLLEAMMIYVLLKNEVLPRGHVFQCLLIGVGIQFLIAGFQFILNHSLGLSFLGEPSIGPEILGVAKHNLVSGFKHIRAYGTFAHPNVLAAYFVIIYFIIQVFKVHKVIKFIKFFDYILFLLTTLALYFTFSRAAFVVFLIGLVAMVVVKKIVKLFSEGAPFDKPRVTLRLRGIGLGMIFIFNLFLFFSLHFIHSNDVSFRERLEQINISRAMILDHPFGVGVGGFTLKMAEFSPHKLAPWDHQPVHNNYFLILNETGIQGLILVLMGVGYGLFGGGRDAMNRSGERRMAMPLYGILLILFLASFDHFFWDNWAGMMLIPFVIQNLRFNIQN